jgi:hypothetical protein
MPESQTATGASMYAMLSSILSELDPMWTKNEVGISTDGASSMTGVSAGLESRLAEAATCECYRVWCGGHQFNICVKATGSAMDKLPAGGASAFDFVGRVSSLAGILRRQGSLSLSMGAKCPRFLEVRWSSLCSTVSWLNANVRHRDLLNFLSSRGLSYDSTAGGDGSVNCKVMWLLMCALELVLARVNSAFGQMQGFESPSQSFSPRMTAFVHTSSRLSV